MSEVIRQVTEVLSESKNKRFKIQDLDPSYLSYFLPDWVLNMRNSDTPTFEGSVNGIPYTLIINKSDGWLFFYSQDLKNSIICNMVDIKRVTLDYRGNSISFEGGNSQTYEISEGGLTHRIVSPKSTSIIDLSSLHTS